MKKLNNDDSSQAEKKQATADHVLYLANVKPATQMEASDEKKLLKL